MRIKIAQLFKGHRKYSTIIILLLISIFLTALIFPVLLENKKQSWNYELPDRIIKIESDALSRYKQKEKRILITGKDFKKELVASLRSENQSYGSLIKLVNEDKYKDYSLQVIAPNGRVIAWSYNPAFKGGKIFPLPYPAGDVFFYRADLVTYLAYIDSVHIDNDNFYMVIARPIEKNYSLQNEYFSEISFTKELSDKFLTEFEIGYTAFAPLTKDGRYYSFSLLNNKNNKIGVITFLKPAPEIIIRDFKEKLSTLQSVLIAIACSFLFWGFRKDYKKLRYRTLKIAALIIYCGVFRTLIYFIGFPSNLLSSSLTEPSYYSSVFAGGMVKSPAEFLLTNLFVLIICIQAAKQAANYVRGGTNAKILNKNIFFVVLVAALFGVNLIIRAWSSSVKSIIFDSTLRYFKEPVLIQNLPSFVMQLNSFCLGFSLLLIITTILYLTSNLCREKFSFTDYMLYISLALVSTVVFISIQHEPLITFPVGLIITSIILLVFFLIYNKQLNRAYNLVYIAFAASFITILLLNFFNQELEKRSLKTIALEINRIDNNYYRYLLTETLSSSVNTPELKEYIYNNSIKADPVAFQLWSKSLLQREPVNSSISIYDTAFQKIGYFKAGEVHEFEYYPGIINVAATDHTMLHESTVDNRKNISGFTPIIDNDSNIKGYISSSVEFDANNLNNPRIPPFIESKQHYKDAAVDINQLKIFLFNDGRLADVSGDIYPSRDQVQPIISARFSAENEALININLNGEDFLAYLYKSRVNDVEKITAILLQVNHVSLNLFNFFKIFIIHTIFLLIILAIIFFTRLKDIQFTFRAQLLTAFLFVSLLPIIILAIYNRQTVTKRITESTYTELNERSAYIERYIRNNISNDSVQPDTLFARVSKELGISFSVFNKSDMIFSSHQELYNAGLLPDKLDPVVYYNLNYLSYRESLVQEKTDAYSFLSFYKKINLWDDNLTIEVNNALNDVKVNLTASDVDIFLFGIYSFAIFLIIIVSTIIANRISRPINLLTSAANRIAVGDLNTEIVSNDKGEMKTLIDGFNMMIKEIRQNQQEMSDLERENAWKEMARQVAHEIKNPLTPMKLAMQQLIIAWNEKRENFDAIFQKLTGTVLNQVDNLSNIASEFSRFGRMPLFKLEKVELLSVIYDSSALFTEEQVKIEIVCHETHLYADADKNQFRRMLINMFRNSIQSGAKNIIVTIEKQSPDINLFIKDDGKGIPEIFRDRIFESNFTTKEKGMGLGLKLSKRFIEGINGKILLYETSSRGTTFKIIIPGLQQQ